jgi:hypothetical protein
MNQVDDLGNGPQWKPLDKVWISTLKCRATVVQQILAHSEDESYWGDVIVRYETGLTGVEKSWQIIRINE